MRFERFTVFHTSGSAAGHDEEQGMERKVGFPIWKLKRKRKEDGKQAALAHGAIHLNSSPVGLDNGSSNSQAQARPGFTLGPYLSSPVKAPEDLFLIFLGDADPRVRDPEEGPFPICTERDFYASSRRGVFNPIIHQV